MQAEYIDTENNTYPVYEHDIRAAFPNSVLPTPLVPPDGYMVVFPTPMPLYDRVTHVARVVDPKLTDKGHYEQQWEVVPRFNDYTDEDGVIHTRAEQEAAAVAADLENRKTEMTRAINAKRDHLETQGFPHADLWFQSDERSVARINSTALTAQSALLAGQPFVSPDWLAEDNTPLPIDAEAMLALQSSLTAHAAALHAHARSLKAATAEAQSAEELLAIDINTGWPGRSSPVT